MTRPHVPPLLLILVPVASSAPAVSRYVISVATIAFVRKDGSLTSASDYVCAVLLKPKRSQVPFGEGHL